MTRAKKSFPAMKAGKRCRGAEISHTHHHFSASLLGGGLLEEIVL
jgi:hypothetical protein